MQHTIPHATFGIRLLDSRSKRWPGNRMQSIPLRLPGLKWTVIAPRPPSKNFVSRDLMGYVLTAFLEGCLSGNNSSPNTRSDAESFETLCLGLTSV